MTANLTNQDYILKTLWPQKRVKNQIYKNHAFLAMLSKMENFTGANMVIAMRYADPQGRNVVFSTAQTAAATNNSKGLKFTITRVHDYQVINIDAETMLSAKDDKGALIQVLDNEIESGLNNLGKSLAVSVIRGKAGDIGQVHATTAITATTLTLLNADQVAAFEVGMVLAAASARTGGSARATPATATITGVNRDTGVLTFAASTFSGTDWAASDYIFSSGDQDAKCSGLEDWVPATAPTSTSFFGADRSVDTRAGGLRLDVSSYNPEEAVVILASRAAREGAEPDYNFVHHKFQRDLTLSLGSKVVTDYKKVGEVGFRSVEIIGPRGNISNVADQDMPVGVGHMVTMDTWKLYSLKEAPHIVMDDSLKMRAIADADGVQLRARYFAQLACDAPGFNIRGVLPEGS